MQELKIKLSQNKRAKRRAHIKLSTSYFFEKLTFQQIFCCKMRNNIALISGQKT